MEAILYFLNSLVSQNVCHALINRAIFLCLLWFFVSMRFNNPVPPKRSRIRYNLMQSLFRNHFVQLVRIVFSEGAIDRRNLFIILFLLNRGHMMNRRLEQGLIKVGFSGKLIQHVFIATSS